MLFQLSTIDKVCFRLPGIVISFQNWPRNTSNFREMSGGQSFPFEGFEFSYSQWIFVQTEGPPGDWDNVLYMCVSFTHHNKCYIRNVYWFKIFNCPESKYTFYFHILISSAHVCLLCNNCVEEFHSILKFTKIVNFLIVNEPVVLWNLKIVSYMVISIGSDHHYLWVE